MKWTGEKEGGLIKLILWPVNHDILISFFKNIICNYLYLSPFFVLLQQF